MMPRVSVVIVNYNAGSHLARCLTSLDRYLTGCDWDAVVVDNASTDGSADAEVGRSSPITVIRQSENLGFGRAINVGVAATRGPLLLFVNPDAAITAEAVSRMTAVLDSHPDCAIVGPLVRDEDGAVQGSARGDPDMMTGVFGRTTLLTRLVPWADAARRNVRTLEPAGAGDGSIEVDWVSGACMLVRRAAFEQVGGFDEGYFLYWEDADLCRRLRLAGHRTRYCPSAEVVHAVGRSSRTAPALAVRAFHASAYRYYATYVAPSPWNPKRWIAWVLLRARCWMKLLGQSPSGPGPKSPG